MLEQMRDADAALTGRKVLIVDDDVRNVFALTSALEAHGMEVVYAENGREALDAAARSNADVDLILMDIMMPELDGYETTRGDPRDAGLRAAADHRADRQGDEGRPREEHRRRAPRTTSPSPSTSTSSSR